MADEPRDDLDLVAVVAAGRRRRQRRRRWTVGAAAAVTATALVAATLGPRLFDDPAEPEPAPPTPKVVPVEVLSLDGAVELPTGALRTHHAPGDNLEGLSWDRWAGVTDDGYIVRIRNVYEADTTSFGLVDPATGRTEWLPESGYDFGDPDPLRLGTDDLVFLDNRNATGAVAVYDRAPAGGRRTPASAPSTGRAIGSTRWLRCRGRSSTRRTGCGSSSRRARR